MKLFVISWVRIIQIAPEDLPDDAVGVDSLDGQPATLDDHKYALDVSGEITIHLVESKQDALDEAQANPVEGYSMNTIRDITEPAVLAQAYLDSHLKPAQIDLDDLARGNHP